METGTQIKDNLCDTDGKCGASTEPMRNCRYFHMLGINCGSKTICRHYRALGTICLHPFALSRKLAEATK